MRNRTLYEVFAEEARAERLGTVLASAPTMPPMTHHAVAAALLRLLARLAREYRDAGHLGSDEAMGIGVGEAAAALYRLADALSAAGRPDDAARAEADGDALRRTMAAVEIDAIEARWAVTV